MMLRLGRILLCGVVLLLTAGPAMAERKDRLFSVVATFSILGDLVGRVGGESILLQTLVGPDGDAHVFEPTPADALALAKAALIFENGLGFEPWLDKLYVASGSRAGRVVVTEGLALLTTASNAPHQPNTHGEVDPHVWHDVVQAIRMVQNIRDALRAADTAHASVYAAAAESYITELHGLDSWIFERIQALPRSRRKLVTSHDTFGYFAQRYGFELVGAVLPAFSTEVTDPSGAEIAALVTKLKSTGIPAIFAENVHHSPLIERVAVAAGVQLAPPLYTDALGHRGSPGEAYHTMMRYNVKTIVEALAR
jgi:zinc/manganese transport system substrate-binding protein